MRFAKGHGTGNDFVVLPDCEDLSPELVRRLCDRRTGIGGDGVLRIIAGDGEAAWFMDYRNADGGIAEMCGNGIRVTAAYLTGLGLAERSVSIGTRAGLKVVRCEADGQFSVDLGPAVATGKSEAVIGGQAYAGLAINVGNPHLACLVEAPLSGFDLTSAPGVEPADFPDGVNVEIFRLTGDQAVEMRVHERGSGETRSCGTGAVAAALAAATATGRPGPWTVSVPGGTLTVALSTSASVLTGPAVIVAKGEISPDWVGPGTGSGPGSPAA